ncbi:MAG: response regulator transcription factor [Lewinella sp.]|nr:response regulator transcription factor [Lewinella sp.]
MKLLKALIIDDEPKLAKVLQLKLGQYCPEVEVAATGGNVQEGEALVRQHQPDLVFLDIAMPGGSGFELIERFSVINFEIIFVTGFNEYVLDALKVSAVDYLLKPVVTEELVEAVGKARRRIADREKIELYHILKHNLKHIGDQDTRVAIPGAQAYDFIRIADIIRCEGWQKYTRIYLRDGSMIVSSYNIGVFKEMLSSYGFYVTHKSHLINTKLITRYLKEGLVVMQDGAQVPVSRRKRDDFIAEVLDPSIWK